LHTPPRELHGNTFFPSNPLHESSSFFGFLWFERNMKTNESQPDFPGVQVAAAERIGPVFTFSMLRAVTLHIGCRHSANRRII